MFCRMCGTQMNENESACPNCGYIREEKRDDNFITNGANYPQGANYQQGANYSQGANYQQGANYPQGANYQQGANYSQGANYQQGANYSQGANYQQDANYSQAANYQQGANYTQGRNYAQGGDYVENTAFVSDTDVNAEAFVPDYVPMAVENKEKSGKKGILVGILIVILVAALAGVGWFVYGSMKDDEKTAVEKTEEKIEETDMVITEDVSEVQTGELEVVEESEEINEEEETKEKPDIKERIDNVIRNKNKMNDVSVAVIDNKDGETFLCNGSSRRFVSWGFYLPVYMAAKDKNNAGAQKILNNQPGVCNAAANTAIEEFGGTDEITEYINDMGYSDTVVGRKYGDTAASRDNYTNAAEAVRMVYEFSQKYDYRNLCYDSASFGIVAPYGAEIYAQVGTENKNAKKNLNLFAVVKGENSDFSIVIMTQNAASDSGVINSVLDEVYDMMENYYEGDN